MAGFRVEIQGDSVGMEITALYKSGTPLEVARATLTKLYVQAHEALIQRLAPPEDKDKLMELERLKWTLGQT